MRYNNDLKIEMIRLDNHSGGVENKFFRIGTNLDIDLYEYEFKPLKRHYITVCKCKRNVFLNKYTLTFLALFTKIIATPIWCMSRCYKRF